MTDWKGNYCWQAFQDRKKDDKSGKIMDDTRFKSDHVIIKTDPVSYKSDPLSIKSDPTSIMSHIARNQLIYQPESETYNLGKTD